MPSLDQLVARRTQALQRIEASIEKIVGADVPTPDLNIVFYGDLRLKEMLIFERLADWVETLESHVGHASVSAPPTDMPFEYLTTDGLRWLAEQRGVDVSELSRKSDLIEALED